jgi:ubiquitin C-terminal hydrolase
MSEDKGVVGIANIGNTCYANAAIQLLRHCSEWSSFCLQGLAEKEVQDNSSKSAKVMSGYLELLKPLWQASKPAYIQPGAFWEMMREVLQGTIYEDFLHRIPHDAHEFLTWFMDQQFMATQKKREFTILPPNNKDDPTESMAREAVKAWIDAFKTQYSPITDLCFGLIRKTSTCQGCGAESRSWETFNMLKIQPSTSPDQDNTLLGMLSRELENEIIEDFACEKCKNRCNIVRTHRIWRLPRNLFVVVKRFNPNGTKNNVPLSFEGLEVSFEDKFAEESPEVSKKYKYKIFGTVDHHGSHMGGHYTSQAYNPLSQKWWLYDDESAYALEQGPKFGSSTYILGFRADI